MRQSGREHIASKLASCHHGPYAIHVEVADLRADVLHTRTGPEPAIDLDGGHETMVWSVSENDMAMPPSVSA